MKSHITVIVVASAVVIGLAVAVFTAHPLESAQTRLDRQINEQVETAQRMLMDYRPITAQLSMQLGSAATQPVDVPPAEWQDSVSKIRQDADGIPGLYLTGSAFRGIGIPDCVKSAMTTVDHILDQTGQVARQNQGVVEGSVNGG